MLGADSERNNDANTSQQALFNLAGTRLHTSTSFHPQSDGIIYVYNNIYGVCTINHQNIGVHIWLPMADGGLTLPTTPLQAAPYKILYGHDPVHVNMPSTVNSSSDSTSLPTT